MPPAARQILANSGVDAQDAAAWSLGSLWKMLAGYFTAGVKAPLKFAEEAMLYTVFTCMAGLLASGSWKKCVDAISVLGFGAISLSAMMQLTMRLLETVQEGQSYLVSFVPVYSGIALVGGQTAGAAAYGCLFFTVATFLSGAIEKLILPVMQIYFCFAVSAAVWGNAGIEEAAQLFLRCLSLLLKWTGVFFGFVLGLQSVLTSSTDSAAAKIGKNVLSAAVPLVGDAASAALTTAQAAVQMLKGSLALAATVALGAAFAPVLLECLLYGAAFCAAGVLSGGTGQKQCMRLCKLFAEGTRLCLSVLVLYFFIVLLSTYLLLLAGSGGI